MNLKKKRPGIYLLPNLITISSLFLGFFALVRAFEGDFNTAAIVVLVCIVLDGLDGHVARSLNIETRFGAEFDSLTDLVVFGLTPAIVMFLWLTAEAGDISTLWRRVIWLTAFFYTATTALRLARFNSQITTEGLRSHVFRGLPCPAAAALVMSLIWVFQEIEFTQNVLWLSLSILMICGIAMVSNFSYFSPKGIDFRNKIPFIVSLFLLAFLTIAAIDISRSILFLAVLYILSGFVNYLVRYVQKRMRQSKRDYDVNK